MAHFPACKEVRKDVPDCEKTFPKYRADIEALQQQFKDRFQDFYAMQPQIALFPAPLSATVCEQPPELHLELCELQSDPFFQAKRNERGISFWKLLSESRFSLLRDFALSMGSMFGSTSTRARRLDPQTLTMTFSLLYTSRRGHKYVIKTELYIDPPAGEGQWLLR